MRLIRIQLKNFRQHRNTDIEFGDGIIAILGKNGAGKSTLLEAIAWTLYGQKAVQRMDRGKVDTIRTRGTSSKDIVEATLDFEIGGQIYTCVRRVNDASLLSGGKPLHKGTEVVTKAVTSLLRMDPQAFFTSFFTGQKDLSFLRDVTSAKRQEYISGLLGYERLSKAAEMVNRERLALTREIEGQKAGMGDIEEIISRRKNNAACLADAEKALQKITEARLQADQLLAEIEPVKQASEQAEKRYNTLQNEMRVLAVRKQNADQQLKKVTLELEEIGSFEKELESLKPDREEFERLAQRNEELVKLMNAQRDRKSCEDQIKNDADDIAKLSRAIEEKEKLLASQMKLESELKKTKLQRNKYQEDMRSMESAWRDERSGLEASLRQITARADEIRQHLKLLLEAGPDGVCPTCERPLGAEFEKVTGDMQRETEGLESEAAKNRKRLQELASEPEPLKQTAGHLAELEKQVAELEQGLYQAKNVSEQLERDRSQREQLKNRILGNQEKLAALPPEPDKNEYDRIRQRGKDLKPRVDRAKMLEGSISRKENLLSDYERHCQLVETLDADISKKQAELDSLGFSLEQHNNVMEKWNAANAAARMAVTDEIAARGEVNKYQALVKEAESQEAAFRKREKELKEKESLCLHLNILRDKLTELRAKLNEQIRPRLSSTAAELLAGMTDGRYTEVDLDENYQPRLFEDGEYKPVISGGEEDVLHLAMRLAVSQMIADRAGVDLGLLILDEVFGSLDDTRRESVISLLQNLKGRFGQILLITHIEAIHDMVDKCIWVDYDISSGNSRIREAMEMPSFEMALI